MLTKFYSVVTNRICIHAVNFQIICYTTRHKVIERIFFFIKFVLRSLKAPATSFPVKSRRQISFSLPQSSRKIQLIFVNIVDKTSKIDSVFITSICTILDNILGYPKIVKHVAFYFT